MTRRPLSLSSASASLRGPGLGGVVLFAGCVRPDATRSGRVRALLYEADPVMARRELGRLEDTARQRFGAERIVLWHRVGPVRVGEISVIVGAACGHRAPAFDAARYLIEELKSSVPIWKTEPVRSARRPRRRPSRTEVRSAG